MNGTTGGRCQGRDENKTTSVDKHWKWYHIMTWQKEKRKMTYWAFLNLNLSGSLMVAILSAAFLSITITKCRESKPK